MLNKLRSLKDHQGFIRYFKNTGWMIAEQFLRIIAGLFVGIWVARYLGPEQFGLFSYVLAFTAIFGGIAKLGLDGILLRELINHPKTRDLYLGTAFWLKVIGAFLVMLLMAIVVTLTSNDTTTNTFIFIIATGLLFQSFEVVEFYFQSEVLAKSVAICKVIQLALSSVIKIYLVLSQSELICFVLVTAFDAFSLAICYFVAFRIRQNVAFYKLFSFSIAKKLLKDSWPMIFTGVVLMIQARIDQIMLKGIQGSTEVGYYSVAMRLIEVAAFLPIVLKSSLFPAIQSAKKYSERLYKIRLLNFYRLNFVAFLVLATPIFLFAEDIVILLFGDTYQPAGILLALFSIRLLFTNMGVARGAYLLTENLIKYSLFTMVMGTIVNVVINVLLIPHYGARGAIVATIISFLFTIFLLDAFYYKSRQNFILQIKGIFTFYKLRLN